MESLIAVSWHFLCVAFRTSVLVRIHETSAVFAESFIAEFGLWQSSEPAFVTIVFVNYISPILQTFSMERLVAVCGQSITWS